MSSHVEHDPRTTMLPPPIAMLTQSTRSVALLTARRLGNQGVPAELSALYEQLSNLEKALTPVPTWSTRLVSAQHPTGAVGAVDEADVHHP